MAKTKIVRVRRSFLGLADRRNQERTINRMERKGWSYVETNKQWAGYMLVFRRD